MVYGNISRNWNHSYLLASSSMALGEWLTTLWYLYRRKMLGLDKVSFSCKPVEKLLSLLLFLFKSKLSFTFQERDTHTHTHTHTAGPPYLRVDWIHRCKGPTLPDHSYEGLEHHRFWNNPLWILRDYYVYLCVCVCTYMYVFMCACVRVCVLCMHAC